MKIRRVVPSYTVPINTKKKKKITYIHSEFGTLSISLLIDTSSVLPNKMVHRGHLTPLNTELALLLYFSIKPVQKENNYLILGKDVYKNFL